VLHVQNVSSLVMLTDTPWYILYCPMRSLYTASFRLSNI
jgi:hypothetical protein